MKQFLGKRNTIQGLVIYYIGLLSFTGMCISISQGANTLKLIGFLGTLCVIAILDLDWIRRSRVHPHDMKLIEQFSNIIQFNKTDLFLKDHDFKVYIYDETNLKPLEVIDLDWNGVDYEFVNGEYQQLWSDTKQNLSQLMKILTNQYSRRGSNFFHLLPSEEDRDKHPEYAHQQAIAGEANALARSVYDNYQAFRRIYLKNKQIEKDTNS